MKDFMSVGTIGKTHGLKGEVKVFSLTDSLERFKKLKNVYIDGEIRKVEGCKLQADKAILKIEGIDTIEQAETYRNKYLMVKREDAVKLTKGSYYVADLLDCAVFEEGSDEELGKVFDVLNTPGNDVYWVKGKEELLIPVLKNIVVSVDINKRIIIIKPVKEWQE
ncbi:ribosome maturation factor RimM [Clostridium estertheticum]|uniref:ribosome maturation factor RimM n=1 Tax=Clostridium estertheticum TaxID=238834 RepID=UPI001C7D5AA0|nr:ribosome maturation factor RimM [Clostridium estertheticum]MBX4269371.1 ribosome maturation factor RimM [Clostridium estertheticum]WLC79283.1 ribosome maturation factor RimM [Clostridium estertheticum]